MEVQQIIRASADVLTITTLAPGNVYKRVEEAYDGKGVLVFGVVQDVMNNGTDAAVTALEYKTDYTSGAAAQLRVFTGAKPVAIFPATPEEVRAHLDDLQKSTKEAAHRAHEAWTKTVRSEEAVQRLVETVGHLSAPSTNVIESTAAEVTE